MRLRFEFLHLLRQLGALLVEHLAVDAHTGLFHVQQNGHERLLDIGIHLAQRLYFLELAPQRFVQLQRDVGVLCRIRRRGLQVDLVEGELLGPLAGDILVMDGFAAEHIREAVPVIASYGDAIGIRTFAKRENFDNDLPDCDFRELTSLIDTPYINMVSAINHPCQSLADWKTMDDLGIPTNGGTFILSWTWHPQALPLAVPAATVY